jgi:diguanylate cyclase (GGDEF)-like protein
MIAILGEGGADWARRVAEVTGVQPIHCLSLADVAGPLYAEVFEGGLRFFVLGISGYAPLSDARLSQGDSDQRVSDVFFLLRQLSAEILRRQRAEDRVSRVQALWQRTRIRYRAHTKAMKEKMWLDPLTQVLNREGVTHFLRRTMQEAQETEVQMTLLVLDLDWFKRINDGYGHVVGDVVLQHVARILAEGVRRTDAVGRVGGEEFCAVLQGCSPESGVGVAEKLRMAVEGWRIFVANKDSVIPSVWAVSGETSVLLLGTWPDGGEDFCDISLTISGGVATFPDDFVANKSSARLLHEIGNATEADILQYMADKALYQAKKEGRNRVCSYRRG